ncbi:MULTISPECIES: family 43 glycosylhydrolase [unclassified Imperialibacter]|uniref:family 43 glycosylhydrolase n=1 Tax=unclassified Imperialibacter TaxID=2629706 RepID=UPI0012516690|nr:MULTISPECIES: family 43 glycosylhydrolase [unclassified Imperialibacter]CAD5264167.1 F5/8 type C domain-containing protein [Imperialibacter sp. 89]CAD5280248.1 F5/8 type C domain-containing protein [Imperialibacter sp. 75]VVT31717.1 F5/8 type C domain-containing protein [Imperialibacter sp. EC-SDR9]
MIRFTLIALLLFTGIASFAQQFTYCNPINIDYGYTPIPNFSEMGRHRATADPVITVFKGKYYLFSTNQWGYWWSDNMYKWNFVPRKFLKPWHDVYDELCAPATLVLGDTLFVIGSTHTKEFPLWMSTNPTVDDWTEAVDKFDGAAWDPAFLEDDDGRVYLYYGSSNFYPMYGIEIDRKTLQPVGERVDMIHLNDSIHGWERFGEHADNTFLAPFMEGAWVNKHNGKYYLQYGAPGTEFSGYADGVYTSDKPLGPWTYQSHNPFAYKPGGFARGAGHGATYQDLSGNWWHVSTIVVGVKNNFERRLGIWPAGFDDDGILYCNTTFGDYPHYLPDGTADHLKSRFTGWMLLNYNKPVQVSSTLGGFAPNQAVDESIKTYWSAANGNKGEWFQTDLGEVSQVNAIQINYADQDADFLGKPTGFYHQYIIYVSDDGEKWKVAINKAQNKTDVPHDYIEFSEPIKARYLKMENIHMPTGKFALSGFRVFGKQNKPLPAPVRHFIVLRGDSERRNAWLKWEQMPDATGYNIYTGIAPDKLYNSVMVYGANEYYFTAMDLDKSYYFQIEPFNEAGVGPRGEVIRVE